ncbi:hypothetical protein SO802_020622 [Lithocarpus litseifolius]|uniref:RNase H type-1 domain-containing protein n=1 Tax=Lithocarpus litseifolius TaxID=425828 RepID=A0AAW2CDM5_9ROSI
MPIPKGASWASQSIFECKNVISKGLCHKIGNGLNTWIFENPWVPNEPGFIPQARSSISIDVHLVTDLIDQDIKQWDKGKLSILFQPPTCDWAVQLRLIALWPLYMSKLSSLSILDWIKVILNPKSMLGLNEESVKDFQLYATILCDHLWMARNKARVKGSKSNPTDLSSEEKTTVAVVGRDTASNLLLAWSEQFESGNSLLGEARAAWCAMRCAMNEEVKNIILEGDAWNVIEPLKKLDVAPHWSIRSIFEDILYFTNCFQMLNFLLFIENVMYLHICMEGDA